MAQMQTMASAPTIPALTDNEVLRAIDAVREAEGSCTYASLARALGFSETAARYRVQKLAARGVVEILAGGIRRRTKTRRRASSQEWLLRVRYDPSSPTPLEVEVVED